MKVASEGYGERGLYDNCVVQECLGAEAPPISFRPLFDFVNTKYK